MYVTEAPADTSVLLVRTSMFSCVSVEAVDEVWARQTMLLSSPLPAANLVTLNQIAHRPEGRPHYPQARGFDVHS